MNADPKRKHLKRDRDRSKQSRRHQEEALDGALRNTFPASDPISIEHPAPPDDLKVTNLNGQITHIPLASDKPPYRK
jgi:hypothetical protein